MGQRLNFGKGQTPVDLPDGVTVGVVGHSFAVYRGPQWVGTVTRLKRPVGHGFVYRAFHLQTNTTVPDLPNFTTALNKILAIHGGAKA